MKMKAAYLLEFGGIDALQLGELEIPEPLEDEVQIKVEYAGVNPVDWKIAEGHLQKRMESFFPLILGWDVAGTISKVGKSVTIYQVGDLIFGYCRKQFMREGSYAEYICLPMHNIARKPNALSFKEAAPIPLSCLTSWQALYEVLKIKKGEKVLIHAGAGGIGSFAIQLAKLAGCYVLTTSTPRHFPYLDRLGADEKIDYTKGFSNLKVDAIFDTVGGETLEKSYTLLNSGGRLVSIVQPPETSRKDIEVRYLFVTPNSEQLQKIASLYDEGKLQIPPIRVYPLEQVNQALHEIKRGRTEGKIVIKINGDL